MSELPAGWAEVALKEVAEVRLGRQRSPEQASGDHMRPYMRAANVTWLGISLDDVKEMNFTPREFVTYELKPGDILLSEASGSASEVGKPAIWRGEVPGACFQNTLIRVRSRGPLPEYLHLHFFADARLGRFATAGKGIGINHLGADRMSSWPTRLPPLNEQRRIVAKLEALQARSRRAHGALDAVPLLLEKLRQSILAAAFRGDLTKNWRASHRNTESATELLKRIRTERRKAWEESEMAALIAKGKAPTDDRWKSKFRPPSAIDAGELSDLPQGWCWASVEELTTDIVDCLHRTPAYVEDGYPAIRTADIVPGKLLLSQARRVTKATYLEQVSRLAPKHGDVLYSREGERFGLAAVVPEDVQLCISQRMMHFRTVETVSSSFFMWALNSPIGYGQARRDVGGSTSPHVNIGSIRRFALPLAPDEEQSVIGAVLDAAFQRAESIAATIEGLREQLLELDRTCLAKAFRGELVPQDPRDEPADAMLQRVALASGAALTKGASSDRGKVSAARAQQPQD